jgi:hypothetical protein
MDTLFEKSYRKTDSVSLDFVRSIMDDIRWDNRLTGIRGARGVGKTRITNKTLWNPKKDYHYKNLLAATIYKHYKEILIFFVNRSTNASAESFNAKIKAFRASLRGVTDVKFFLFRLATIFA